jgi:TRAP transporter TAXI family solute receptor
MLHGGELEFGLNNLVDGHMYYNGVKPWRQFAGVRLVTPVFRLYSSMIVPGDSDIKSIADAKGKRITADFRAHLISRFSTQGLIATAGLGFNDFRQVPVSSHSHGVRALMEGRVDIAYGAVGPPVVREANAALSGGIRFLPVGRNHPALQKTLPGVSVEKVRAGFFRGIIKEPTDLVTIDVYFVSGQKAPDALVYATTKAIWNKIGELKKAHRALRAKLSHSWMVQSGVTIPYHRAAIRFYKEQGAWTDAAEKNYRALLANQNQQP